MMAHRPHAGLDSAEQGRDARPVPTICELSSFYCFVYRVLTDHAGWQILQLQRSQCLQKQNQRAPLRRSIEKSDLADHARILLGGQHIVGVLEKAAFFLSNMGPHDIDE